jgi:hypothetical protein
MYLLLYQNDDTTLASKMHLPITGCSERVTLSQTGKIKSNRARMVKVSFNKQSHNNYTATMQHQIR